MRSLEESKLVFTDSNVGKSIASRIGSSRETKHVELRCLYVQELVASGMVRVKKVLGTLNPADILTKYTAKDTLHRRLPTFSGLRFDLFLLWVCGGHSSLFPEEPRRERRDFES